MKKNVLSVCAVMFAAFVLFLAVSCDAVGVDPFFHYVTVIVDDSVIGSEIVYHNNEYTLPGEQKKDGYIFDCWTDGKTDYKAGETLRINEDVTFRVKWIEGYLISYDANGGNGESVTDVVRTGSYGTLRSDDIFSKNGYVIDGWYTSADADGDFYEAEARITPEGNLRLYAHWVDSRLSYVIDAETGTYSVKASEPLSSSPDISSVYKGKKVTAIADGAFKNSTFSSIVIPSTITAIGSRVIDGCTNLRTIALPDSVKSIASDAFEGSSLSTISVGKDEEDFVSGAPWGAESASMKWKQYAVTFVSGGASGTREPQFFTKGTEFTLEGALDSEGKGFTKAESVFDCWADNADNPSHYYISGESVTFDSAVTLYALWVDEALEFTADDGTNPTGYSVSVRDEKKTTVTAVTIPATYHGKPVTTIKNFSVCTMLESVTINSGNVTIDEGAFRDVDTLSSVVLASGTKIKADAFNGCKDLDSISLAGVLEIGDRAFANSGLTSVTVPVSVTALGAGVFYNCTGLSEAELGCSPSELKSYTGDTVTPSEIYGFFENCSSLESFTIPDSVTKIGDETFKNSGLESITFSTGSSLTEIGQEAFSGTKLVSAAIPEGVTKAGAGAFSDCIELTGVEIPSSLTEIGKEMFSGCEDLETVTFRETSKVSAIGEKAFHGCTNLDNIALPKSTDTIGTRAFENCSSLANFTFEADTTLEEIRDYVFSGCTLLTSIALPDETKKIDSNAFSASGITSITVGKDMEEFAAKDGYPWGAASGSVRWKQYEITFNANGGVGSKAKQSFTKDTAVSFSDSTGFTKTGCRFDHWNSSNEGNGTVYEIGNDKAYTLTASITVYAVWVDENLEFVYDSTAGAYSVKVRAERKTEAQDITIPSSYRGKSVTAIADNGFEGCTGLRKVVLPESVKKVGPSGFRGCTSLSEVNLENVGTIGAEAFKGCSALNDVSLTGAVSIGDMAFASSGLESVNVPSTVTTLGGGVFYGCGGLSSVTLGVNPTELKSYISGSDTFGFFEDCISLSQIDLPSNLKSIEKEAFRNCSSLSSVVIPSSVTSIDDNSFEGTSALGSLTYQETSTLSSIGKEVFKNSGLKTFPVPESVTTIDSSAFALSSLTKISFAVDDVSSSISGYPWGAGDSVVEWKQYTVSFYDNTEEITNLRKTGAKNGSITLESYSKTGFFFDCWTIGSYYYDAGTSYTISGDTSFSVSWKNPDIAYEYNSSSDSYTVKSAGSVSGKVEIPSSYRGKSVMTIADSAFKDKTAVTEVVIPSTVAAIGNNAFEGCTTLGSVTFDGTSTLSSIGSKVFDGCTALGEISLPNSFTTSDAIAQDAFSGSGITAISIGVDKDQFKPTSTTCWGAVGASVKYAQYTVTFKNGSEVLKTQQYEKGDMTISYSPDDTAGAYFDAWNTSSDGSGKYYEVTGTYSVTQDATLYAQWKDIDAVFEYDSATQTYTLTSSGNGVTGAVTIPSTYRGKNVVAVAGNAFSDKTGITSVTIPDTVKTIGDSAFRGCTALNAMTFSGTAGLTSIGKEAFRDTALTSVSIPSSVTSIGDAAFAESSLTSIVIPNTVTSLGGGMFYNCTSLTAVTLPENASVTSLASYDFGGTEGERGFFEGCSSLTSVTTPANITNIGNCAFKNCTELTGVTYGGAVTSIGKEAFCGCSKLTAATVPAGVTEVSEGAFSSSGITSVNFEGTAVTKVGKNAFSGCTGLTSVTIPDSVTALDEKAFAGCAGLSSVSIGSGITTIASDAFENCPNLLLISIDRTTREVTSMTGEDTRWGAGETCAVCGNTEEIYVVALVDESYTDSKKVTMKAWKEESDGTKSYKVGTESQGVTVAFNNLGVSGGGGFYTIKVPSNDFNRVEIKTSKQTHEYTIDLASNPNKDVMLTLAYSSEFSRILYEVQYQAKGNLSKWYDESKVTNVDSYTYVTAMITDLTLRKKTTTAKMWITSTEGGTTKYHLGNSSGITVTSKNETFTVKVPTSTFTNIKVTAGGSTWTCTVDLASNPGTDILWMLQSPNIIKYIEKDSFADSAGTVTQ